MVKERTILLSDFGLKALRKHPLTKVESIALWHLVSTIPVAGEAVSHADLGQTLKIPPGNISKTMKYFCEIGFLVRGPKLGKNYHYKINPLYFRIL